MPSEPTVLRTVIIEDNAVLLDLLTGMLAGIEGVSVVGHAASEAEALAQVVQRREVFAPVGVEALQHHVALEAMPGRRID